MAGPMSPPECNRGHPGSSDPLHATRAIARIGISAHS